MNRFIWSSDEFPAPPRDGRHVYLLEVIGSQLGAERGAGFFEVTYAGTEGFPMRADERLHLIFDQPSGTQGRAVRRLAAGAKWSRLFGGPL